MTNLLNQGFGLLDRCLNESRAVSGVYAEFGVFAGSTFSHILSFAEKQGKLAYAVDSFRGMADPVAKDGDTIYHKGRFDQGGTADFIKTMNSNNHSHTSYRIVEGFIPASLSSIQDLTFAFARVDLDQYYPTKCVFEYLLPRLHKNSLVLCDDYFADCHCAASLACDEFLYEHCDAVMLVTIEGRELCWKLNDSYHLKEG